MSDSTIMVQDDDVVLRVPRRAVAWAAEWLGTSPEEYLEQVVTLSTTAVNNHKLWDDEIGKGMKKTGKEEREHDISYERRARKGHITRRFKHWAHEENRRQFWDRFTKFANGPTVD